MAAPLFLSRSKNITQLRLPPYLFRYARYSTHFDGSYFDILKQGTIPFKKLPWPQILRYFSEIENAQILLVKMRRPCITRKYMLSRQLEDAFHEDMIRFLETAMACGVMAKEAIFEYLMAYGIQEEEYSFERAKKRWTRHCQAVASGRKKSLALETPWNEFSKAPNRRTRRHLPDLGGA